MEQLDNDWEKFLENEIINEETYNECEYEKNIIETPKSGNIYISTKTKIVFLNQQIDLYNLFWKIKILDYHIPKNGVIKKQMKLTCKNIEQSNIIDENLRREKYFKQNIISFVDKNNSKPYKKVQKISVGLCKKDIISHRVKEKGAFYNCFAIIFRIKQKCVFKEVHVKVFNTGKLEIPGIQDDDILYKTLDELIKTLQPLMKEKLYYIKENIDTVLINSNFNCGYYINRDEIFKLLKMKYGLICMYDPCSYPGIQCKFFYNKNKSIQNGICECIKTCSKKSPNSTCREISFMIFRTGSILIVGNCNEEILYIIYDFIKKILKDEFTNINEGIITNFTKSKNMNKKSKYREIIIDL
jgi:TATA-box binding protein (TBP) (component of TFIID and TFIIIB)